MEFTPLLAVELVVGLLALLASSYFKRLIKALRVHQRIKHYPGTSLHHAQLSRMT